MLKAFNSFHDFIIQLSESIIMPLAFFLSCGLLVYFYISITDHLLLKIIFGIAAFYVDLLAWRIWGTAHSYSELIKTTADKNLKKSYHWRAGVLRFYLVIYLILCSGPADVSFFISELTAKEKMAGQVEFDTAAAQNRINVIDELTRAYGLQMVAEAQKKGYGNRSEAITNQLTALAKERVELSESLKNPPGVFKTVYVNPFDGLAGALGIPSVWLKIQQFLVLVFMIQLGLLLNPWAVSVKSDTKPTGNLFKFSGLTTAVAEPEPVTPENEFPIFINAMYKTEDGKAGPLRGNKKIEELTGIPRDRCVAYKNILKQANIFGKPLVSMRSGVCETAFSKDLVLDYVRKGVV